MGQGFVPRGNDDDDSLEDAMPELEKMEGYIECSGCGHEFKAEIEPQIKPGGDEVKWHADAYCQTCVEESPLKGLVVKIIDPLDIVQQD